MPYAITENGWRAVPEEYTQEDLAEGETLVDEVPQSLVDSMAAAEANNLLVQAETTWRADEMAFIGYQMTAIEDEDPAALPGTTEEWRAYRIKVRAWVDGATGYPDSTQRPVRPTA